MLHPENGPDIISLPEWRQLVAGFLPFLRGAFAQRVDSDLDAAFANLLERTPAGPQPQNGARAALFSENCETEMRIDAIAIGNNPPEDINVIIEVSIGGEPIKYEMDKDAGTLVVDRFLYTPMRYPGNYGFVPHTLSEDGDPIDVLVANTRPIIPGAVINVRPIGVFQMQDDKGSDEKIIAVPTHKLTKRYDGVKTYKDMPPISLEQIQHFFEHYKDLEPGKWVKAIGWADVTDAKRYIVEAIDRAKRAEK
jgi:inorganic pyrophosphatase